jgi:hypothetical protein
MQRRRASAIGRVGGEWVRARVPPSSSLAAARFDPEQPVHGTKTDGTDDESRPGKPRPVAAIGGDQQDTAGDEADAAVVGADVGFHAGSAALGRRRVKGQAGIMQSSVSG